MKFAVPLVDSVKPEKAIEMNKLIGDSYYNLAKYQDAIPYESLQSICNAWKPVTHSLEESVSIYYYAKADLLLRLKQLTHHPQLFHEVFQRRPVYIIDAESLMLEDWNEWKSQLNAIKDKNAIIFILGADYLLTENRIDILSKISLHHSDFLSQSYILAFSLNATHPKYKHVFQKNSLLSQNYVVHPLHDKATTFHFIAHMSKLWDLGISKKDMTFISEYCGGNFYFVKQALRILRNKQIVTKESLLSDTAMIQKLEMTWNLFHEEEKRLLQGSFSGRGLNLELDFLKKTGYIVKKSISLPILADFVEKYSKKNTLNIVNNVIHVNGVPLYKEFSHTEHRLMALFIDTSGALTSRDEIAAMLWNEESEDGFSDWAIDQRISRLRSKLKRLQLNTSLKTVKGKGYVYE